MNFSKMVGRAQEAMTVRRVYAEPYVTDGVTVIPAASIRGAVGGGGGDDKSDDREAAGSGGGMTIKATPVGAFVIRGNTVSWKPSYDVNRVILGVLGAQLTVIVSLIVRSQQGQSRTISPVGRKGSSMPKRLLARAKKAART